MHSKTKESQISWADIESDPEEMIFEDGPIFSDSDGDEFSDGNNDCIQRQPADPVPSLNLAIEEHASAISAALQDREKQLQAALHILSAAVTECGGVVVYGSMYWPPRQRLALPTNNIDIVACSMPRAQQWCSMLLQRLNGALRQHSCAHGAGADVVIHLRGRRSVLRLVVKGGSVAIDVTLDSMSNFKMH